NENVKKALDRMKESHRQTYEDVIVGMMKKIKEDRKNLEELMIEGAKVMAEDSLKMVKEWESTDATLDWEWDES
ncbi:hypothetical protein HYZ97_00465, partial [Candidatus Pacearchaeota archaeon]|nr:hypothetical protein [Candidatus Pacearchaeota archaeon]